MTGNNIFGISGLPISKTWTKGFLMTSQTASNLAPNSIDEVYNNGAIGGNHFSQNEVDFWNLTPSALTNRGWSFIARNGRGGSVAECMSIYKNGNVDIVGTITSPTITAIDTSLIHITSTYLKSLVIGTVYTLAAGSMPTITNTGTSMSQILNFGIPAGPSLSSAYLYIARNQDDTYRADKATIKFSGLEYTHKGITVINNIITISETGMYFVTCFLNGNATGNPDFMFMDAITDTQVPNTPSFSVPVSGYQGTVQTSFIVHLLQHQSFCVKMMITSNDVRPQFVTYDAPGITNTSASLSMVKID
jgi:hypothetical protein